METIRQAVQETPTEEIIAEPVPDKAEALPTEGKATDEVDRVDVYESEKGSKYASDYFNASELMADFRVKMNIGSIDKFVKEALKSEGEVITTSNYEIFLKNLEQEIGSDQLTIMKRLQRIAQYIEIKKKLKKAEDLKKAFFGE